MFLLNVFGKPPASSLSGVLRGREFFLIFQSVIRRWDARWGGGGDLKGQVDI
jgi:hypothetical protein